MIKKHKSIIDNLGNLLLLGISIVFNIGLIWFIIKLSFVGFIITLPLGYIAVKAYINSQGSSEDTLIDKIMLIQLGVFIVYMGILMLMVVVKEYRPSSNKGIDWDNAHIIGRY